MKETGCFCSRLDGFYIACNVCLYVVFFLCISYCLFMVRFMCTISYSVYFISLKKKSIQLFGQKKTSILFFQFNLFGRYKKIYIYIVSAHNGKIPYEIFICVNFMRVWTWGTQQNTGMVYSLFLREQYRVNVEERCFEMQRRENYEKNN